MSAKLILFVSWFVRKFGGLFDSLPCSLRTSYIWKPPYVGGCCFSAPNSEGFRPEGGRQRGRGRGRQGWEEAARHDGKVARPKCSFLSSFLPFLCCRFSLALFWFLDLSLEFDISLDRYLTVSFQIIGSMALPQAAAAWY